MPCPYFEPRTPIRRATPVDGRLPLIDEYDGVCHAMRAVTPVPENVRLRGCNHGYSAECCESFPSADGRSASRYTVIHRSQTTLDILRITEKDYAPEGWQQIRYRIASGEMEGAAIDPCIRAQIAAFCQSYLRRFPQFT